MGFSNIAKNFAALVSSNVIVQGLRFLTIAYLARRLGNLKFGAFNYIILLITYGLTIVEFGLRNYGIREFVQGRGSWKSVKLICGIRLIVAFLAWSCVILFSARAFPSGEFFVLTAVSAGVLFLNALLLDFVLISRERLTTNSKFNIIQASIFYFLVLIWVGSQSDITRVGFIYFLSNLVWVALIFFASKKEIDQMPVQPSGSTRSVIYAAVPFLVTQILGALQFSMDLLLLGQFRFDEWLGDYGTALKILGLALGIINAFLSAVQPRFAAHSNDLKSVEIRTLVYSTTRFLWIILAPTVLGCWFFGHQLVLWFFGPEFPRAGELLKPLSLAMAMFCLSLGPMHALYISDQFKRMMRVSIFNCVFAALVVGVVLFQGHPQWVAWAMVLVQAVYMVVAWIPYGPRMIFTKEEGYRLVLPNVLLLAPLLSPAPMPPGVRFAVAGAAYVLGLVVIKVWRRPWFLILARK